MTFLLIVLLLNFVPSVILRNITDIKTRIVGGQTVKKREDFPYQASIRFRQQHYCGGAIITSQHILTAAHCCFDEYSQPIDQRFHTVVVGDLNAYKPSNETVERNVISVKPHEEYWPTDVKNDIAVMKLKEEFGKWTPFIRNIELAVTPPKDGEMCVVSGWGLLKEDGGRPEVLQMLVLPILQTTMCNNLYRGRLRNGMMCAGYIKGGKDSCQGDSGGPLACNGVLYGIVSWGEGCARDRKPGIYVDVSYYRNWIIEKGLKGSTDSLHRQRSRCVLLLYIIINYYYLH